MLYILLSYVPIAVLAPGIGGVIILTALFWAPADHIGNNVVRIIVKAIILIIAIMIEFCIVINATSVKRINEFKAKFTLPVGTLNLTISTGW